MSANFDFSAILNMLISAEISKQDPKIGKILNVFAKKGISVMDALAMMMEISTIVGESENGENET